MEPMRPLAAVELEGALTSPSALGQEPGPSQPMAVIFPAIQTAVVAADAWRCITLAAALAGLFRLAAAPAINTEEREQSISKPPGPLHRRCWWTGERRPQWR